MKTTATLFALLLLFWHNPALCLGLGNPDLHTLLGEKLQLDVPVIGLGEITDEDLKIKIASQATYKKLGVDYDTLHSKLRFKLNRTNKEKPVLEISSTHVINEPYLHFVMEIVYPQGTVLKDISVLLDAPQQQPTL